ncbi:hypothetical protein MFLAVUS_009315 [Mucor flavus]|uniref:Uncharacterized protein n=1 Tax=Mucor flavus TaxID=439312 RepID=A0ABP9Z9J5_9FUNG
MIPDELAIFKLSRSHQPGTDLIGKLIARHQSIVDMITTELLNAKEGTYTGSNTAFADGIECDVLYVPQSSNSPSLPPIIIDVQHTVTQTFMARAAQYCLNVFHRSHVLPKHFAKFCYLVTKGSIDWYVDNVDEDMNPIVEFGHFLLSGQQSIIGIDRWDALTILKLYSIAKDVMDNGTNVDTTEGIT